MKFCLFSVASLASTSTAFMAPSFRIGKSRAAPRSSTTIASSMDEYERQLAAAFGQQAPPAPVAPAPVEPAPAAPAPATYSAPPATPAAPAAPTAPASGGGSPGAAIATLSAAQTASVDSIAATIGPDLEMRPEASWTSETIAGSPATLDGREAPGANGNVAWLASTNVASKLSSLTIFNGPLTDVPHLLSRVSVTPDSASLRLTLDFRPRAYGAYELRNADGTYPGPETLGRDAFTFSGNRNDFDNKFGTAEVVSFIEGIPTSLEGAAFCTDQPSEMDLLTRGPLFLDVTCPLTDGNAAAIAAARSKAAEYWLGWAMDTSHGHRPGAPINSQYVYDEKFRINAYQALLEDYTNAFGSADGAKLAAAESGPLGEAYVGGGS